MSRRDNYYSSQGFAPGVPRLSYVGHRPPDTPHAGYPIQSHPVPSVPFARPTMGYSGHYLSYAADSNKIPENKDSAQTRSNVYNSITLPRQNYSEPDRTRQESDRSAVELDRSRTERRQEPENSRLESERPRQEIRSYEVEKVKSGQSTNMADLQYVSKAKEIVMRAKMMLSNLDNLQKKAELSSLGSLNSYINPLNPVGKLISKESVGNVGIESSATGYGASQAATASEIKPRTDGYNPNTLDCLLKSIGFNLPVPKLVPEEHPPPGQVSKKEEKKMYEDFSDSDEEFSKATVPSEKSKASVPAPVPVTVPRHVLAEDLIITAQPIKTAIQSEKLEPTIPIHAPKQVLAEKLIITATPDANLSSRSISVKKRSPSSSRSPVRDEKKKKRLTRSRSKSSEHRKILTKSRSKSSEHRKSPKYDMFKDSPIEKRFGKSPPRRNSNYNRWDSPHYLSRRLPLRNDLRYSPSRDDFRSRFASPVNRRYKHPWSREDRNYLVGRNYKRSRSRDRRDSRDSRNSKRSRSRDDRSTSPLKKAKKKDSKHSPVRRESKHSSPEEDLQKKGDVKSEETLKQGNTEKKFKKLKKIKQNLSDNSEKSKIISSAIDDITKKSVKLPVITPFDLTVDSSAYSTDADKDVNSSDQSVAVKGKKTEVKHLFEDQGDHWCKDCNCISKTIANQLNHLHTEEHYKNANVRKESRRSFQKKKKKKKKKGDIHHAIALPIKGVEFLKSLQSYWCVLCEVICQDTIKAEEHLDSLLHYNKYQEYIGENPNYEKNFELEKTVKACARSKTEEETPVQAEMESKVKDTVEVTESAKTVTDSNTTSTVNTKSLPFIGKLPHLRKNKESVAKSAVKTMDKEVQCNFNESSAAKQNIVDVFGVQNAAIIQGIGDRFHSGVSETIASKTHTDSAEGDDDTTDVVTAANVKIGKKKEDQKSVFDKFICIESESGLKELPCVVDESEYGMATCEYIPEQWRCNYDTSQGSESQNTAEKSSSGGTIQQGCNVTYEYGVAGKICGKDNFVKKQKFSTKKDISVNSSRVVDNAESQNVEGDNYDIVSMEVENAEMEDNVKDRNDVDVNADICVKGDGKQRGNGKDDNVSIKSNKRQKKSKNNKTSRSDDSKFDSVAGIVENTEDENDTRNEHEVDSNEIINNEEVESKNEESLDDIQSDSSNEAISIVRHLLLQTIARVTFIATRGDPLNDSHAADVTEQEDLSSDIECDDSLLDIDNELTDRTDFVKRVDGVDDDGLAIVEEILSDLIDEICASYVSESDCDENAAAEGVYEVVDECCSLASVEENMDVVSLSSEASIEVGSDVNENMVEVIFSSDNEQGSVSNCDNYNDTNCNEDLVRDKFDSGDRRVVILNDEANIMPNVMVNMKNEIPERIKLKNSKHIESRDESAQDHPSSQVIKSVIKQMRETQGQIKKEEKLSISLEAENSAEVDHSCDEILSKFSVDNVKTESSKVSVHQRLGRVIEPVLVASQEMIKCETDCVSAVVEAALDSSHSPANDIRMDEVQGETAKINNFPALVPVSFANSPSTLFPCERIKSEHIDSLVNDWDNEEELILAPAPGFEDDVPHSVGGVPPIVDDVPPAVDDVPHTADDVPHTVDDVPCTVGDVPHIVDVVSHTFDDDPHIVNDVPHTVNDVPPIVDDVPPTVGDVPHTFDDVPHTVDANDQESRTLSAGKDAASQDADDICIIEMPTKAPDVIELPDSPVYPYEDTEEILETASDPSVANPGDGPRHYQDICGIFQV